MARFQGKRVSGKWFVVLTAAWKDGVRFRLNSGQRTLAEQTKLFNQNMHLVAGRWVPRPGRPLTAFPSPNAPHIRVGRSNHALDVDSFAEGGGEEKLETWLEREGVNWMNNVPGETWHGELSAADLTKLYKRFRDLIKLRGPEWRWVREYDRLKKAGRGKDRREVLQRVMTDRRKMIWRSAEGRIKNVRKGWTVDSRLLRYNLLKERTQ
jgi:hypothetical protein